LGATRELLRQNLRLFAVIGAVAYIGIVAINALHIWGIGWRVVPVLEMILMIVPLASGSALIGALPLVFSRSLRSDAVGLVVVAGALFAPAIPVFTITNAVRMHAFQLAATRAQPLIGAVEKYVDDKGAAPRTLQELVPTYIGAIPSGLPELEVVSGPHTPGLYMGNQWILSAAVTRGWNFDSFLYFPNQQYPEKGYGGSLERIGKWAYVHE
jgi:hypothetical protein